VIVSSDRYLDFGERDLVAWQVLGIFVIHNGSIATQTHRVYKFTWKKITMLAYTTYGRDLGRSLALQNP